MDKKFLLTYLNGYKDAVFAIYNDIYDLFDSYYEEEKIDIDSKLEEVAEQLYKEIKEFKKKEE